MEAQNWFIWAIETGNATSGNRSECFILPADVNSHGVWRRYMSNDGNELLHYYLPYMLLSLLAVFVLWESIHFVLKRFGILKLTSQMIAGIALSYFYDIQLRERDRRLSVVGVMGAFGYTMWNFIIGVKMNTGIISTTGSKAVWIGILSVFVPMMCNSIRFGRFLAMNDKHIPSTQGETTILLAMNSITSFPNVATLMTELQLQNSELGRLALSTALISDLLSAALAALANVGHEYSVEKHVAYRDGGIILLFLFFACAVFRPALLWVIKTTPEGKKVKDIYIYTILVLVFGSALCMEKIKQFIVLGPLILGLAVPSGAPLGSTLTDKLESFVSGALLPFFITYCMARLDVWGVSGGKTLRQMMRTIKMGYKKGYELIIVSFMAKFFATLIPSLVSRMPLTDSIALGFVISKKGIVELGAYTFAHDKNTITVGAFIIGVSYILLNSAIVPIVVRVLYDPSKKYVGYKRRDMMHMKPNTEFRIISCIHRLDNINPMVNLLEAMSPSKESPVGAFILHLVPLVGSSQPLFISHQLQSMEGGNTSYSDNVILSFDKLRRNYWGLISVNTFTSVSSPKYMHEDICMLALDKITSLIILPFHRTWSADGLAIVSDSKMIQNLNKSVLELAPCSVAILVDRSRVGSRTLRKVQEGDSRYQVCMVFLGGKDDREALTLAKRMASDTKLELTVVRIKPSEDSAVGEWESSLDTAVLEDVRLNTISETYIMYIEEVVKDGTETAPVLKSMIDEYDLFIVGKGSGMNTNLTEGLEEWSEFKELGIIGDLLASKDFESKSSILVVQQQ